MSASHVRFFPSKSVSLAASDLATTVTLPPPDPANAAIVLRNNGPQLVALRLGTAAPAPFHAAGSVTLHAGQTTLLASDPGWSTAEAVTLQALPGGMLTGEGVVLWGKSTSITITRGRVEERWLFGAPEIEVI